MASVKNEFLNRDLSWLSFNKRVLMEAADETVPLFNRISFLAIFASNLDEFFRVRMPSIFAFEDIKGRKIGLRDEYPKGLPTLVQDVVQHQLEEFGRILQHQLLPALRRSHIHLYYAEEIHPTHKDLARDYFFSRALAFLQPVSLRANPSFFPENNALYFIVEVSEENSAESDYFILNIPSSKLERFHKLPMIGDDHYFMFLDDVIRENLDVVFPNRTIKGAWSIKLTRDAELNLVDEFTGDLAAKIERQLTKRDIGPSTRFLFDQSMPKELKEFLRTYFSLREAEMVEGGRYHNLKDLADLPNPVGTPLLYRDWPSLPHPGFNTGTSCFASIAHGDRMVHVPYHSYDSILRFFNEAAIDPAVQEVYVTLYRVAADSLIANALIAAAKNGKKVTVFVELKARFDEANNLRWSRMMKSAGVRIINSLPGLKVHAKVALVKRMEEGKLKGYALLSTGNFNESTGRFYCDHILCTAEDSICKELQLLFDYLRSHKFVARNHFVPFKVLLVSQFNMVHRFRKLIMREIRNAKKGLPAEIIVKVNNLQEREMISLLYAASEAGVKVRLIVRSICCVAAGIGGMSSNITVHRIVDRYLEHARIFHFHNNGNPECYLGSADWMNRNLHSRIEVCFPILDKKIYEEIIHILRMQLRDNIKAVRFTAESENERIQPEGPVIRSQQEIYRFVRAIGSDNHSMPSLPPRVNEPLKFFE